MASQLTDRQVQVLNFIHRHHVAAGYWPSVREVQAHFKFKSTNAVAGHLRALEAKGAIIRMAGHARAFRVVSDPETRPRGATEVVDVPVFGQIAAGFPVGVEPATVGDRVQVDAAQFRRGGAARAFAVRVQGESMIDAGINDGDTVVVEPRQPRDGDVVVALIDGQSTLKRFKQPADASPFLQSENRAFPALHPVEELVIQGVATALVRKI